MIKKLTILTALLSLSGCSTYVDNKICDPNKNYLNINIEAIENYKKIVANGEVNSYYLKIIPMESCENNKCLTYSKSKYDFQEIYFNDNLRKGIYTISINSQSKNEKCIIKKYSSDKNCYFVTKNDNDDIKSRFYMESNYTDNVFYKKFIDLKTNTVLFESSYQIYHVATPLGNPSAKTCKIKQNPENYIFDIYSYPK